MKSDIFIDKHPSAWYNCNGSCFDTTRKTLTRWRLLSLWRKRNVFYLPQFAEGGDAMDYITWSDLVQIALLVFTIISCFFDKSKKD